jgi:hypothetical protein
MTSCSIPSSLPVSARMPWTAFKHVWPRKWPCITFASGSTCSLGAILWLLLICLIGKFVISIHTKRLSHTRRGLRHLVRASGCQGTDASRLVCGRPLWSLSCSNFLDFIGSCWSLLVFVCPGCCTYCCTVERGRQGNDYLQDLL